MIVKKIFLVILYVIDFLIEFVDEIGTLILKLIGWVIVIYFLAINDIKNIPVNVIQLIMVAHFLNFYIPKLRTFWRGINENEKGE